MSILVSGRAARDLNSDSFPRMARPLCREDPAVVAISHIIMLQSLFVAGMAHAFATFDRASLVNRPRFVPLVSAITLVAPIVTQAAFGFITNGRADDGSCNGGSGTCAFAAAVSELVANNATDDPTDDRAAGVVVGTCRVVATIHRNALIAGDISFVFDPALAARFMDFYVFINGARFDDSSVIGKMLCGRSSFGMVCLRHVA